MSVRPLLSPRPRKDDSAETVEPLVVDANQKANGTTQATGLGHISYLLRQFELFAVHVDKSSGDVKEIHYNPGHAVYKPEVQQYWLAAIATLMFFVVWFPCRRSGMNAMDATLVPLLAAHLVLYVIVYHSTNFALYRSDSFVDGWNTITRFTTKMPLPLKDSTFVRSHMPSSISSSVSTRGSTLNKLMIGVTFCLGTCLFIKFIQAEDTWATIIAFGYLCLIFTGMYENRTFNLDESQPPIIHHRLEALSAEGKITFEEQQDVQCYDRFHILGVTMFVIITFVGQTGWYYSTPLDKRQPWQDHAWWLALISVCLAGVFGVFNSLLVVPLTEDSNIIQRWAAGVASPTVNKLRGLSCITIEMSALMFATAAGLVSQVVPVAAIHQMQ